MHQYSLSLRKGISIAPISDIVFSYFVLFTRCIILFSFTLQLLLFLINVPKCSLLIITRREKDKRAKARRRVLARKTICLANPFRKRQACQWCLYRMVSHNHGREQEWFLMGLFSQTGIIMPKEKSWSSCSKLLGDSSVTRLVGISFFLCLCLLPFSF